VTLDVKGVLGALLEVELEKVATFVASEQTLNQNCRAVSLKASLEAVNVDLKIEFVLLGTRLITVVRDVPFHVFV
jgi:hypothetical protein